MNLTHEMVYLYNAQNQNETVASLNIDKYDESTPNLYIFNGTKKVAHYISLMALKRWRIFPTVMAGIRPSLRTSLQRL